MPIQRIEGINDPRVGKLNELLDKYNDLKPNKITQKERLNMLQRIDAEARHIFDDYLAANPNQDSNKFYNWFKSDPLISEFITYFQVNEDELEFNNQRLIELLDFKINSLAYDASSLPDNLSMILDDYSKLKKANKSGIANIEVIKSALEVCLTYENLINERHDASISTEKYYQKLQEVKDIIISIRNDIPSSKKNKGLRQQLDQMLQDVNFRSVSFAATNDLKQNLDRHRCPIKPINDRLNGKEKNDLFDTLHAAKDKQGNKKEYNIDGYSFRGLGGKNNQNWLVTDTDSLETFVVRIEKFVDANPFKGMERESLYRIQEKGANPHIEQNFETVPLGAFPTGGNGALEEYVMAIGEYCSKGDILNTAYKMPINEEENFDKILDMISQICEFNKELISQGYTYTDLKAENFLLRDDGTVITSDLKSITQLDGDGMVQLYNAFGRAQRPMTIMHPGNRIGEILENSAGKVDPEFMSSYLIATIMNTMIGADRDKYPAGTHDRHMSGTFLFDFTHPVYNTAKGKSVKALIEKISTSGPDNIVKLDTIITEINKIQKMELQNSAGLQPQSRVINQNKIRMSQTLVSNTLMELNSDQNDSWETFIKVCIDFENIIPETKFITRLPLNKQMEYADKIRDFSDVDNTQSLALAVACVLKALSTPNSVDKAFGDTTALKQFLDKFNSGQIDGDVRSVIYQIVEQKEGTELTVEHYAAQEEKITQMTDIALEQGFEVIYSDLQSRA